MYNFEIDELLVGKSEYREMILEVLEGLIFNVFYGELMYLKVVDWVWVFDVVI